MLPIALKQVTAKSRPVLRKWKARGRGSTSSTNTSTPCKRLSLLCSCRRRRCHHHLPRSSSWQRTRHQWHGHRYPQHYPHCPQQKRACPQLPWTLSSPQRHQLRRMTLNLGRSFPCFMWFRGPKRRCLRRSPCPASRCLSSLPRRRVQAGRRSQSRWKSLWRRRRMRKQKTPRSLRRSVMYRYAWHDYKIC